MENFIIGIISFLVLSLVAYLGVKWGEYKQLQRAISIADRASGFIDELKDKETGYKTSEMGNVVWTLRKAANQGHGHLKNKGSSEL